MSFGVGLGTVNPLAELFELISGQGLYGPRDIASAFVEELFKASEERVARMKRVRGVAKQSAYAIRRIRRKRGRIEKRRIGSARCFVPHCKDRLRRERGLVIFRARRAGFVGHNAAHANYKNVACRQRHLLLKPRRAKPELT